MPRRSLFPSLIRKRNLLVRIGRRLKTFRPGVQPPRQVKSKLEQSWMRVWKML